MIKISSRAKLFLVITAALLFAAADVSYAREVFKTYDVTVQIHEDSTMTVTENIVAVVENIEINRGIVRVFPVEYKDANNRRITVGFDVLSVKLDGQDTPFQVSSSGRYKELRIGDANRVIRPGDHLFTIVYKTSKQLGFFENHDELYWNVTGNDWTFPILSASCNVALPGGKFGEGFNSIEWYVGKYGEKGRKSDAALLADGTVRTTRTLSRQEGFTVVYTWPKGIVTPPPPPRTDNTAAQTGIAAATFVLLTGWLLFAWKKWGKEPTAKPVIPLFYPPEGGSPAYARYIKDMKADQTSFTAAVIGLAVKGALLIEEEEGVKTFFGTAKNTITLEKEEPTPQGLAVEEQALLKQLFPGMMDTLELKQSNRERLVNAFRSLGRNLRTRNDELFTKNTSKMLPALFIYFIGVAALIPFSGEYPVTVIFAGLEGLFILLFGMRMGKIKNNIFGDIKQFLFRVLPYVILGVFMSGALIEIGISPAPLLFFIAAAAVFSVMRPLMMARTQHGADLLSEVEGLRLYMDTAEKERLEMFNPPEETPQLFERLLPYALALGVAKTWGNRFEKILAAAQYEPTWYVGPSPYIFMNSRNLNAFSNNLQSQMTSSMSTPSSSPGSSSGSGGGGFSGGGGGGGGGRGW